MQVHKQIDDLRLVIDLEKENYKTAIISRYSFPLLSQMRSNIKKLKADLQALLEQQLNTQVN